MAQHMGFLFPPHNALALTGKFLAFILPSLLPEAVEDVHTIWKFVSQLLI
jgi:hypothetical protein